MGKNQFRLSLMHVVDNFHLQKLLLWYIKFVQNEFGFGVSSAHPHQQATSRWFEQICHCLLVRSERLKGNRGQTKSPKTFFACLFVLLSSVCSVC